MRSRDPTPRVRIRAADTLLIVAAAVLVLVPGLLVASGVVRGLAREGLPHDWLDAGLLGRTLAAAGGTAALAVVLAWPAALVARGGRVALILVPLLMPSYLAYAGWGLVRAPGTPIGNWLASLGAGGAPWAPLLAGRALAVVGLALWSWPIAAVIVGAAARGLDPGVIDALRLEASALRRQRVLVRALARPIAAAWAIVALVMLGSAVPFHVAQLDTYAIRVWFELSLAGRGEAWRAYVAAAPLLVVAGAGGWLVSSHVVRAHASPEPPRPGRGRAAAAFTAIVWTCSVLVPLALFATSLHEARSLVTFWRVSGAAVANSVLDALLAGVGAVLLAVASAYALGGRAGRLTTLSIRLLVVAGLVPGVLVGSALVEAYGRFGWIGGTPVIAVMGDLARFGMVAVLAGALVARWEPPELRHMRRLDGAVSLGGWWRACGSAAAPVLIGAGLVVAILSLHEIEASVILEPPGAGSLAQALLSSLHYARDEALAAGVVQVMLAGLVLALVAAWLVTREPPAPAPRTPR